MIDQFTGTYAFLSNFYPIEVCYNGDVYPSVEHAYQAAKTLNIVDRAKIRLATSPTMAKRLGKKVTLRDDWAYRKIEVMKGLLWQKFRYPELQKMLELTKPDELVEGNWWGDTFWGVCKGIGENHLGKLLMEIRDGNTSFVR